MAKIQWKRIAAPETSEPTGVTFWDWLDEDFDRLWGWPKFSRTAGLLDRSESPAVDMLDTMNECVIWVEVPGLDKKDIDLSIAGRVLTLKGEKKAGGKTGAKAHIYRDETWAGSFQRSLSLPETCDTNKIRAEFQDGILQITVAKKTEHKPRQIAVAVR